MSHMTNDTDVQAWLDRLQQRVDLGEAAVGQGEDAELHGLDEDVAAFCGAVRGLPLEAGQRLRPKLEVLLQGVDRLQAMMRERHDAMKDEMQDHSRRAQATRAYGDRKPPGGSKP